MTVKPTRVRDLPVDVEQYALGNAIFPQQSTADQWYDEAQFESYRRLGECAGEKTLESLQSLAAAAGLPSPGQLFGELMARHRTPAAAPAPAPAPALALAPGAE